MVLDRRRLLSRSFLIIALYCLFNYVFAHLAYLNMNTQTGEMYEYISLYLSKISDFIIPVAISALTLAVFANKGLKKALPFALLLSLARVLYYLPYYYIIFIFNYAYDSIESIILSLIASGLVILFTPTLALISILICVSIIKRQNKSTDDFQVRTYIKESLSEKQQLSDLTRGANLCFLITSLISLISSIIPEIFDTVSFFVEYGFDYSAGEILTIMFNYTLLFVLTVGTYFAVAHIRNKIVDKSTSAVPDQLDNDTV